MAMSKRQELWLIVFLGVMSAMAPLSTDMYLPALPTVQNDLGISASVAQMTLTMTLIGMAVGQIFLGPISDRYGRKVPLLIGMILFTIATAGCVLAENIWLFLLFRFLAGFAGSSGIVIARAIARDVCEGAELTRFFAILMMVNGLAPILAPVLGGQILLFTSWRGVFIVLVVVGILQAGATMVYKETLPLADRITNLGDSFWKFPQLLKDRYFLGHCLLQCFIFGAFFSYLAGSSFVFQNIYAVSPQMYSLIFGGIGVGLMLAGMLPARLAGRVPDVVLLKYSILVPLAGSIFLLGGFLAEMPIWYTVLVLFITVVPLSVIGAASFSLALSRQGKNAGSASALIGFFSMILGGCMMPVVGIAGDHTAVPMGIIMVIGYALGVLCYYTMIAPAHRETK
jgi:DHA1 family bicyclomycin/chloramphenicol resistance-like MFS transporter